MKTKKKPLQQVIYVLLLLAAVVVLFQWYTLQNKARMEEQNKNYAADSAHMKVSQITDEFKNGIKGQSGTAIVFNSSLYGKTMVSFYTPVHYKGKLAGVFRGAYMAEKYLQKMLSTTYFGEQADVFLCMADGTVLPIPRTRFMAKTWLRNWKKLVLLTMIQHLKQKKYLTREEKGHLYAPLNARQTISV